MTIQLKATEQCFPVLLFIMLYKVVIIIFESVDEILKCDHPNESYWRYFPVVLFIMPYEEVITFKLLKKYNTAFHQLSLLSSTFPWFHSLLTFLRKKKKEKF